MKDMAENAVPGNMKFLMFKIWLAQKFSCCLGTPEMPKMGLVDVDLPDVDIPEVDLPDKPDLPEKPEMALPKIGL